MMTAMIARRYDLMSISRCLEIPTDTKDRLYIDLDMRIVITL